MIGVTTTNNLPINLREKIEEIICNLENTQNKKLSKKKMTLLIFIATKNYYKNGVTKDQLEFKFNYTLDYAEKIIYQLRKDVLIISSGIRRGHRMTYFLSNMQDFIPLKDLHTKHPNNLSKEHSSLDEDIVLVLLKKLSNDKGLFHNFRIQTKLLDKRGYDRLNVTDNGSWTLQSIKNKIKVVNIRLSSFRTIKLQVSPNA